MNQNELKTWLQENLNNAVERAFFHDEFPDNADYLEEYDEDAIFFNDAKENGIEWESVDSHGGEGKGDEYWNVVKFTSGDAIAYVQFDGWYQSYNGSEYDEWFFVEPKEVTVTRYTRVK